jgi:hypothetical protein
MSRGFIDCETTELVQCECGSKPTQYSIGFGPTPYSVHCPGCKKSTNSYRNVGGHHQNIIDFWNLIAPLKELDQRIYRIGTEKFTARDSFKIRCHMLDTNDFDIFVQFENGEIKYPDYKRFLSKNDY